MPDLPDSTDAKALLRDARLIADSLEVHEDRVESARIIRALVALAEQGEARTAEACGWEQEGWGGEGDNTWATGCGHTFTINEGPPSENDMKFCCYCGKSVVETRWDPQREEDPAAARSAGGHDAEK